MSITEPDFEQLFAENYEPLVRALTAVAGNRELAEDCVQEAFIRASVRWRRIRRYDDPAAWVRRVAINRSRDLLRSDRRRRSREDRVVPLDHIHPDHGAAIGDSMSIVAALQGLPERQREAASLYYIADLPVSAIADTIGISVGAVKFHLSASRTALRGVLEQKGPVCG